MLVDDNNPSIVVFKGSLPGAYNHLFPHNSNQSPLMSFFVDAYPSPSSSSSSNNNKRRKYIKVDDVRDRMAVDSGVKHILERIPNDPYPDPIPWYWDKCHPSWWPKWPNRCFRLTAPPPNAPFVAIGTKRNLPWLNY